MPAAATRNSGLELEAVVQATEAAANRIMEAAEAISDWLRDGSADPASVQAVNEKVNAIFEACSFQDVTGQRIRRAIQHLQQVETMLTDIVPEGEAAGAAAPAAERQPRSVAGRGGFDVRLEAPLAHPVMARLVRATYRGRVLGQVARTSRAMAGWDVA